MAINKYRLSFTSASFALQDSILISHLYDTIGNWDLVLKKIIADSLLEPVATKSKKRKFKEIKIRLSTLSQKTISLIYTSSLETQKQILFLAICKTYTFIREFVIEVLFDKISNFEQTLFESDYTKYVREKSEQYSKLDSVSDSTLVKLRCNTFSILIEIGLLEKSRDGEYDIIPQFIENEVKAVISNELLLNHYFLTLE